MNKVINHLRRADRLLIVLPMILSGILFVIVPIVWSIAERASGNPTEIGGFNFDGLLIFAGIFLSLIFCALYGLLALVLSVLTRRNITFRVLLVGTSLITAAVLCFLLFFGQI